MQITNKDRKNNYKRLKKYKDKNIFIDTDGITEEEKVFIKSFNEKNLKIRYEYIYDYMCKYLDKNVCKLCDFKNNKCIANRLNKSVQEKNGCCYFRKEGLCKYLKNKKCENPNISCKLFMCSYIEKNKLGFSSIPKNYLLLNFFFNKKQKDILQRSFKVDKDLTIKKLLNNK